MVGVSWLFVLSLPDASTTKTHSRTNRGEKKTGGNWRGDEEKKRKKKRLDFFLGVCGGRRARIRERPGLFLALRGCLAFDARSECSSRAPGCCSRRALLWKCLRIQPRTLTLSLLSPSSLSSPFSLLSSPHTRRFVNPPCAFTHRRKSITPPCANKNKHVSTKGLVVVNYMHILYTAAACNM